MYKRTIVACSIALVFLFAAAGCPRILAGSMKSNRFGSSRSGSPEDMTFSFKPLDAKAVKKLQAYRDKWAQYVEKFDASNLKGAAQVTAVMDAYNNAHWSERPSAEDFARPLAVAIGDVIRHDGEVDWVLGNGVSICLISTTGKVAVAPLDTAIAWINTRTHPLDKFISEVSTAVRDTTGTPVQIGFKDQEDGANNDMF